jgi:hypothetical protein
VAENEKLNTVPGLAEELKNRLKIIFECNGCTVFKM